MAQAKQTFRPEFLGRIDEMIVMNSLTQEDGAKIAELMLEKVKARLSSRVLRSMIRKCPCCWLKAV